MTSSLQAVGYVEAMVPGAKPDRCPICGSSDYFELLTAPDRFHGRTKAYRLIRCKSCSLVWLASPPKPSEMSLHYTDEYHKDIAAAGEAFAIRRWKNQVRLISEYKSGGSILDIGCSSGGFLSTMRGPNWKLYGIEMEQSTAEHAMVKTGADVFIGDAGDAPFLPSSFDVITCFDVLEHLYSPSELLKKVLQWLKPGGIFYAMMPNIDSWEARLFGTYWYGLELPRHLYHFSPDSVRCLMSKVGFEEVEIQTPRVTYVERTFGYLASPQVSRSEWLSRRRAKWNGSNIAWRIIRKAIRMAIEAPLSELASLAGAGPCLELVFTKPSPWRPSNQL